LVAPDMTMPVEVSGISAGSGPVWAGVACTRQRHESGFLRQPRASVRRLSSREPILSAQDGPSGWSRGPGRCTQCKHVQPRGRQIEPWATGWTDRLDPTQSPDGAAGRLGAWPDATSRRVGTRLHLRACGRNQFHSARRRYAELRGGPTSPQRPGSSACTSRAVVTRWP
jgi:hypothetical protein